LQKDVNRRFGLFVPALKRKGFRNQGDQTGRILAHWGLFSMAVLMKTTEEAQIFGLLVSTFKVLLHFWANFS
jgi:hypothetical protein